MFLGLVTSYEMRDGEGCKLARSDAADGGDDKGEGLGGLVALLVGMEPESVFRTS